MPEQASGTCPMQAELAEFVSGNIDQSREAKILGHLESCRDCSCLIRELDAAAGLALDQTFLECRSQLPEVDCARLLELARVTSAGFLVSASLSDRGVVGSSLEVQFDGLPLIAFGGADSGGCSLRRGAATGSIASVVGLFLGCLLLTTVLFFFAFSIVQNQWKGDRQQAVSGGTVVDNSEGVPSMANTRRRKKQADLRANQVQVVEPRVLLAAANVFVDNTPATQTGTLGTSSNPYLTIQAAVNAINAGTAPGMTGVSDIPGSVINIAAGVYRETVDLSGLSNFNGTAANPITFQKWGTGTVTINGADLVGLAGDDFTLTTLPGSGVTAYQTTAMNWSLGSGNDQVFVDGVMQTLAGSRPVSSAMLGISNNWATVDTVSVVGTEVVNDTTYYYYEITDAALNNRANQWVGGKFNVLPGAEYSVFSMNVLANYMTHMTSGNTLIVKTSQALLPGNHYYMSGALEGISENGEWIRSGSTLYLKFAADPDSRLVEAKRRDVVINANNRKFVVFDGINIFAGGIVTNSSSENLTFINMNAKYVGHTDYVWFGSQGTGQNSDPGSGVVLNGKNHVVKNSTFQFAALSAITVKGGSGHKIINNTFLDTNYAGNTGGAITCAPVAVAGTTSRTPVANNVEIAFNTILRTGSAGLIIGGFDMSSFHHNEIGFASLLTADTGGINAMQFSVSNGNVIAYNTVHDVYSNGVASSTKPSGGIYLDNGSAGYVIHHNVVYNTRQALKLNTDTNAQNHRIIQNTLIGDADSVSSWGVAGSQVMTGTELWNNLLIGAVNVYDQSIVKSGNLIYSSRTAAQAASVFTNLASNTLTLASGSPAAESGSLDNSATPYSFGYIGSLPASGAVDSGQAMFLTGRQTSNILPINNGALGRPVNPGTTTLWASQYDTLGQGVSYSDSNPGNTKNTVWRPKEGVDNSPNGIVGDLTANEWLNYTVNVTTAGLYKLSISSQGATGTGGTITISVGDGFVYSDVGSITISGTPSYSDSSPIEFSLNPGANVIRLKVASGSGFNIKEIKLASVQLAYGVLKTLNGGTTEFNATEFDIGGQNEAYYDTTSGNSVGNGSTRNDEWVESVNTGMVGFSGNEWVEYTVYVATPGVYNVDFLATGTNKHIKVAWGDGRVFGPYSATITVPQAPTTSYTSPIPVTFTKGIHVLRIFSYEGNVNISKIRFQYVSSLEAESAGGNTSAAVLTTQQAAPIFAEAKRRWQNLGVKASAFNGVTFSIADLPDNTLAVSSGKSITIDSNAANWGWFVDPTPGDDREFQRAGDQGEQGRMDLLTTVMHELGHVLGLDHSENGVMEETLSPGERDVPSASDFVTVGGQRLAPLTRRTFAIGETIAAPVAATNPSNSLRRPWWWG